jgi:hypothetical protein
MRPLIERILGVLFPVKRYRIKTGEEAREWFRFEAPNHHPEHDPFRPMGPRDSWAGKVKEHDAPRQLTVRERRQGWKT